MEKPKEVTIHTLQEATAQEVFNHIAWHLLTQNKRAATTKDTCRYRFGEFSCSIGCLMPDKDYNPAWEGTSYQNIIKSPSGVTPHKLLLGDLQIVHDWRATTEWTTQLCRVALSHKLEVNVIKHFTGNSAN